MAAHLEQTTLEGERCWKWCCQQQQCCVVGWRLDSCGSLNNLLVILADQPTNTCIIIFHVARLQFAEFMLLLHRHIRRVSLLVRRKTCSLGTASKLFSYLFYTCIFLKSRRRDTTAGSLLLTILSLLLMSELPDQLSSKAQRYKGLKDLTLMQFAQ